MSTACLLNPMVRKERARRRDAVREMYGKSVIETGPTKFQLRAIAARLDKIRKNPSMTGREKEAWFFHVVGRFYRNVHEFAAQAEERRQAAMHARRAEEKWYAKLSRGVKGAFDRWRK